MFAFVLETKAHVGVHELTPLISAYCLSWLGISQTLASLKVQRYTSSRINRAFFFSLVSLLPCFPDFLIW